MIIDVDRYRLNCLRCGHKWFPKQADIRQCPKCRSALWDVPPGEQSPEPLKPARKSRAKPKPTVSVAMPKPEGVSEQIWEEFKRHRNKKRGVTVPTVIDYFRREAAKAGISLEDAMRISIERGWQGFEAEWVKDKSQPNKPGLLWNGIDKQDFGERRKI